MPRKTIARLSRKESHSRTRTLALLLIATGLLTVVLQPSLPPTNAASLSLFGRIIAPSGWGLTSTTVTSPGPSINVAPGESVTLTLKAADSFQHNWGVDYNGNGVHDPAEPISSNFVTTGTTFTFTSTTTPGTYTYYCFLHGGPMIGSFIVSAPADVAVSSIVTSRNFAYAGTSSNPVKVNVTAANLGTTSQNFFVSAKANTTLIGNQTVTVPAGQTAVVSFQWNAAALPRGTYILAAQATRVAGEANTANNAITHSTDFTVRFKADLNNDCTTNGQDFAILGAYFLATPPSNPFSDINNDATVNGIDLAILGSAFLQSC